MWCFALSVLLEASKLERCFSGRGNASELGSVSRAPSAGTGHNTRDQAQAGEIPSLASGRSGARHLSWPSSTSQLEASSHHTSPKTGEHAGPVLKNPPTNSAARRAQRRFKGLVFPCCAYVA